MFCKTFLGEIFDEFLKKWDRKLGREKRKILLFVDNCSAHPKIQLQNIELKFFLPNTTAESQVNLINFLICFFSLWIKESFKI